MEANELREWDDSLNVLIGMTIREIIVSEDSNNITFNTDEGEFKFDSFGDCCSDSWIESVDNPEALLGQKVNDVKSFDIDTVDVSEAHNKFKGRCGDQESLSVYRYDILTDKGTCTIDFRNSSNGYYGGNLQRVYA